MRTNTHEKKAPFYGVGGTRTHARPPTPIFRGSKALPTELRLRWDRTQQKTTVFFPTFFYLTITLMIRVTTDLIPSRFLTYNPLLKALTGLMVIAYIIMIRKLI